MDTELLKVKVAQLDRGKLLNHAKRWCAWLPHQQEEDVVQEAQLETWKYLDKLESSGDREDSEPPMNCPVEAFVMELVKLIALDRRRKHARRVRLLEEHLQSVEQPSSSTPSKEAIARERERMVTTALFKAARKRGALQLKVLLVAVIGCKLSDRPSAMLEYFKVSGGHTDFVDAETFRKAWRQVKRQLIRDPNLAWILDEFPEIRGVPRRRSKRRGIAKMKAKNTVRRRVEKGGLDVKTQTTNLTV